MPNLLASSQITIRSTSSRSTSSRRKHVFVQSAMRRTNDSPGLSDKLVEDLTAHRTVALRTMLATNADVALSAVVHALALPVFFPHETESRSHGSSTTRSSRWCCQTRPSDDRAHRVDSDPKREGLLDLKPARRDRPGSSNSQAPCRS